MTTPHPIMWAAVPRRDCWFLEEGGEEERRGIEGRREKKRRTRWIEGFRVYLGREQCQYKPVSGSRTALLLELEPPSPETIDAFSSVAAVLRPHKDAPLRPPRRVSQALEQPSPSASDGRRKVRGRGGGGEEEEEGGEEEEEEGGSRWIH